MDHPEAGAPVCAVYIDKYPVQADASPVVHQVEDGAVEIIGTHADKNI